MVFGCLDRLLVATICLVQVCTSFVAVPVVPRTFVRIVGDSSRSSKPSLWHDRREHDATRRRIPRTTVSRIRQATTTMSHHHHDQNQNHGDEIIVPATTEGRRSFLKHRLLASASAVAFGSGDSTGDGSFLFSFSFPSVANAAMKSDQTTFSVGKDLTVDEAKARFREGQDSLGYLLEHYDEIISEGGGDNVRRYLGTVGTTSGLYGIAKVLKTMQASAEDIVEYTETMNEINASLVGADGSAYMAIFSKSHPDTYYGDAKVDVKRAIGSMEDIAKQMNIVR